MKTAKGQKIELETKKVYKIQRRADQKFSSGGTSPKFSDRGKLWTTISGLKNHLNLVNHILNCYAGCDVITVQVTHEVIQAVSMEEVLSERIRLKEEKKRRIKEASEREKTEHDLAELARLKTIYEPGA